MRYEPSVRYRETVLLITVAMLPFAPVALAEKPDITRIDCTASTTPIITVALDLRAVAPEPNVRIESPGQIHRKVYAAWQALEGDEFSQFYGKTWYSAQPGEGIYFNAYISNETPETGGFGDLRSNSNTFYLTCRGS